MPIRIEREHHFAMPVESGFAFITDMANWPRYWPGFVRIEPGSRWSAPGDEARIVIRLLGRKVALRMTLRHFEENQLVEYESTQSGMPDAHHERHSYRPTAGSSTASWSSMSRDLGSEASTTGFSCGRGVERALRQTVANVDATLAA